MSLAAVDTSATPSTLNPHTPAMPNAQATPPHHGAGQAFADVRPPQADPANNVAAAPDRSRDAYIVVAPRDSLWGIADRHVVPGATLYQKMVAIFNANPHAFIENDMSRLKAGARLALPSRETILAIDAAQARRICADHIDAAEQRRHGTVQRGATQAAIPVQLNAGDSVIVQFGDTLGAIAKKYAVPDATLAQKIVAIFDANPHAFVGGNMNRLETGVRLVMPDAANVAAIETGAAQGIVNEQWLEYQRWRAG
jgi:FimV-like protein